MYKKVVDIDCITNNLHVKHDGAEKAEQGESRGRTGGE